MCIHKTGCPHITFSPHCVTQMYGLYQHLNNHFRNVQNVLLTSISYQCQKINADAQNMAERVTIHNVYLVFSAFLLLFSVFHSTNYSIFSFELMFNHFYLI